MKLLRPASIAAALFAGLWLAASCRGAGEKQPAPAAAKDADEAEPTVVAVAASSAAPPAPAPAPPCPPEMTLVADRFCIDRWEAITLDPDGKVHSPYKAVGAKKVVAASRGAVVPQGYISADESDAANAVTYRKAASVMSTAYQNYQNLQGIKNGGAPGSDPAGSSGTGAASQPKYNPPAPPASNSQGQQTEEPPATSGGTGGFRTTVNRPPPPQQPPPQQNSTPAPTTSTTTTRTVRIVIIIRTGGGVGCPPH